MKFENCKLQIVRAARSARLQFPIFLFQFAICNGLVGAENWPDYRGLTGQGVSDAAELPLIWSEARNVRWKTAIPGKGWSTPVIWGNQIWMTTADEEGHERSALCVDRESGRIVHQIKVFEVAQVAPQHGLNSHASPSPVIEEGRVYVHFGTYGTACIDTETGEILWRRTDLNIDHQVGPGSSPVLFENLLIVHCDGTDYQYIVALDKKTGQIVWKSVRSAPLTELSPAMRKASCTPIIVNVNDKPQLLSVGSHAFYGYDPRRGSELWRVRFAGFSNVARPVSDGKIAVFSTGYERAELVGVELASAGKPRKGDVPGSIPLDLTDTNVLWTQPRNAPNMPSPLLVDGLVYTTDDGGVASCLDAATGEVIWRQRIGGNYSASPIYASGRVYFSSQEGKTTVIAAGREFKELAVNTLDDGFMASPAVSGRALFLRTRSHLYRVEEIAK